MIAGRKSRKLLSGLMAALLLLQPVAADAAVSYMTEGNGVISQPDNAESGREYYFSSVNGNDSNDGSREQPFQSLTKIDTLTLQPGDKLLLERGSVFNDQYIHLQNVGDIEGNPIVIEPYGQGERPRINTNGSGVWYQDYRQRSSNGAHKWQGEVSTALLLRDVENIEVRGLEITNWVETEADGKALNDPDLIDRTGVAGVAQNRGTLEHIVMDDLYVHDIKGNIINKQMLNGGIYFVSFLPDKVSANTDEIASGDIPRYDDLRIENCHVENVIRRGIGAGHTVYWNKFQTKAISDEICRTWGSTNVVIRNNYLKDVGGDAITPQYCFRPLVEYNVSQGAAKYISTEYFPNNTHRVAAGIWPWKCKDAVFQRNECFDTKNRLTGNQDAQAWDADSGEGTIYQYNYSHGNTGGCVMFCAGEAYRNTFRYNISQNDEHAMFCLPRNPDAHIYNNTFYIKEGVDIISSFMSNGAANMENNIFYYTGSTPKNETWYRSQSIQTYDNNLYYNYSSIPSGDANGIVADGREVFAAPGQAPAGPRSSGRPYELSAFEGYKLAEGSPAIGAGKIVIDDNGFQPEADFFGTALTGIREIGAAESDAVLLRLDSAVYNIQTEGVDGINSISGLAANTTREALEHNLLYDRGAVLSVKKEGKEVSAEEIVKYPMTVELSYEGEVIVYQILPDDDGTLHDSGFMVRGSELFVPSTDRNPCTLSTLLQGVEVADTAVVSVWNGTDEVNSGTVSDGMKLKITAEDGVHESVYTVRIRNEYHWTRDFVDGQQGNVWFAQIRDEAGAYSEGTSYNPTYAVWNLGESYTIVGAEGNKGEVTESKHGLICDWRPGSPTPYMAFRAPMAGKVSFALKADEPYLRQTGNSGGSVKLELFVNDEAVPGQSCEMSQSEQKADFPTVELEVQRGDFIRLRALAVGTPTKPSVFATPIITYLDQEVEDREAPSAPTEVAVSHITSDSARVSWGPALDNMGVEKYEIYQDARLIASVSGSAAETVLTGLAGETTYEMEICAVDGAGNKSVSVSFCFTTATDQEPVKPDGETEAYKKQLRELIARAEEAVAGGKYSETSVRALEQQIARWKPLLDAASPAKEELKQAIAGVQGAIDQLELMNTGDGGKPFPFTDVEQTAGNWKYESVKFVYNNDIMNGISGTALFRPDSPLTRAMFATVLYRMA
ncbi:MAG: fibronectin type III domain-containing protein, partial [Kineothrix sp.]